MRQTEKEVGRQHEGIYRPGVHQVPEGLVVVVVAFSSRARILGECLTVHSPHAFKKIYIY